MAFAMVGTGLVILIVAIYILMNAACIGFCLIYMIYLYRTNPQRVSDVGLVHLDAIEEDAAGE